MMDDLAIDGVRVPVELRMEVMWPSYERRLVALEVSEGESKRIDLRLTDDAAPGRPHEAFETWIWQDVGNSQRRLTIGPTHQDAAVWPRSRPCSPHDPTGRKRRSRGYGGLLPCCSRPTACRQTWPRLSVTPTPARTPSWTHGNGRSLRRWNPTISETGLWSSGRSGKN